MGCYKNIFPLVGNMSHGESLLLKLWVYLSPASKCHLEALSVFCLDLEIKYKGLLKCIQNKQCAPSIWEGFVPGMTQIE